MANFKSFAIGARGDGSYVTLPDPDYFGESVEEIFDQMQADGVTRTQVINLSAYEDVEIFWDRDKRPTT